MSKKSKKKQKRDKEVRKKAQVVRNNWSREQKRGKYFPTPVPVKVQVKTSEENVEGEETPFRAVVR